MVKKIIAMILMLVTINASAKERYQISDLKISGNFVYAHIDDFTTLSFNKKSKKSVIFSSDTCIARDCIKKINTKKQILILKNDFSLNLKNN